MRRRRFDLSIPVIFASLASQNIDVFLGNWMPAQEGDRSPYTSKHAIDVIGPNLEHARFTLAVPHYLYQAGLTGFGSIAAFSGPLHSSLYGIEPGAAANRLMLGMIKNNDFGLGNFKLIESSEQGMLAELERAYRAQLPIVFVAWDPHPMNLRFDIDYLSGGDSTFGPDFGGATVNTLTRAGLAAQCPNLGRLLRNLKFSVRGESEMMSAMLDRHEQPDVAARAWLENHPNDVDAWLQGVSMADGKAAATLRKGAAQAKTDNFEGWMTAHKIPLGDANDRAHRGREVPRQLVVRRHQPLDACAHQRSLRAAVPASGALAHRHPQCVQLGDEALVAAVAIGCGRIALHPESGLLDIDSRDLVADSGRGLVVHRHRGSGLRGWPPLIIRGCSRRSGHSST